MAAAALMDGAQFDVKGRPRKWRRAGRKAGVVRV